MISRLSQNIVPLIIACALFMENLDASVIATALPAISRSLNTNPLHLNLAITSYMFSLAVFIPLSGWAADRFSALTIFRLAMIIFMASSAGCGMAQNLTQLVFWRLLQGMGGAMMVPVGRLVLLRTIPKANLVSAMAWVTVPALIGPVLGPPVGGFIVTYWSWHWIFYINVPIGLVGVILATRYIPHAREPDPGPLDVRGFLLMALSLAGLVCGFESVGRDMLPAPVVAMALITGIASFMMYLRYARKHANPIVDIKLMNIQTYRAATLGGSLFRIGIGAMPFLLPLMLQFGFGLSALNSGMLTFAGAAGAMLMKFTAARVIRRYGFRRVVIVNSFITCVYFLGIALFRQDTPHAYILLFLLMGGFFRSLQFTAMNTLAYADITPQLMSKATTLVSMLQQLSLSLGVATGALFLHLTLAWNHTTVLGPQSFWPAIVGVSLVATTSVLFFIRLPEQAGSEISGHTLPEAQVKRADPAD